jgi:hypothetical protein
MLAHPGSRSISVIAVDPTKFTLSANDPTFGHAVDSGRRTFCRRPAGVFGVFRNRSGKKSNSRHSVTKSRPPHLGKEPRKVCAKDLLDAVGRPPSTREVIGELPESPRFVVFGDQIKNIRCLAWRSYSGLLALFDEFVVVGAILVIDLDS